MGSLKKHHQRRSVRNRLSRIELVEQRNLLTGDLVVGAAEPSEPVADFSLVDVNSTSATFDQEIGPSDFRGQVSAWYFGFAT